MAVPISKSIRTGRVTAAVKDSILRPCDLTPAPPVILFGHGASGDCTATIGTGLPAVGTLCASLAASRYMVACPTVTELWGNATDRTRRTAMRTYAQANGGRAGKVPLIGLSMGFASSALWAYNNPTLTSCIVGVIPAIDKQAIRVGDSIGQRAVIDAADGVTYPAALPSGTNPNADPARAVLATIPQLLFYSSDDTTPSPTTGASENIEAYAAATGATLVNLGALGHSNAAIEAVATTHFPTLLRFILDH